MEIRSAYSPHKSHDFDQSIPDPITGEIQVSMTKQSFADETNINNILDKYKKTGLIEHVKNHGGYSEMPDPIEYQQAVQMSIDAQLAFDDLPAHVRREFDNDPFTFLSFIEDPDNVERMAELGLIEAPDVEETPPEAKPLPAEKADEKSAPKTDS